MELIVALAIVTVFPSVTTEPPPKPRGTLDNLVLIVKTSKQAVVNVKEVTLPNGKVYKTASTVNGGVYDGDMREQIGKALISTGINLANYGVADSAGSSQQQPNYFRQTVIHQSVGMYANGRIRHGYSGGNGMATLHDVHGNEFSHELGHGYGLGHYPGGGRWSSHHMDSGWGYDAFRHRML